MIHLKNTLIEKILCERYKKTNQECMCEETESSSQNVSKYLETLYMITRGVKVPWEMINAINTKIKPIEDEEIAKPKKETVPSINDPNRMGMPRTSKTKEFSIATGQVISP